MADTGGSLVLGFIGSEPVHKDNSRALLGDLVAAYKRDNKSAKVRFILPTEPYSETMSELADYCLISGHQLSLVGHADTFDSDDWAHYKEAAEGNLYPLNETTSVAKGIVSALSVWDEARLILVADPNIDDDAYVALVTAHGMGIKVRSLLHGLDVVMIETPEEETPEMRIVDEDEYEDEEESEDEVVDEVEEDDYEDDEEDVVDEEEVTEDVEEATEEEDDDGYYDIEAEEDDDVVDEEPEPEEEGDEDDVEDFDAGGDDAEDDSVEEEKEEKVAAPSVKMTEVGLTKLAEKDREAFYELAAEYDVFPGRGQKVSVMVRKVLEGAGVATPSKKAPAARKATPAKKALDKKVATAKKPPAAKRTAPRIERTQKSAPASSNGHVDKAAVRSFIKLAQSAIDMAEQLL